jgi:hypothetical protein
MATNQQKLYLPTPNAKGGLTYSKKVIAIIKYHWIDIPSKDFDGVLSTPTVKGLEKNFERLSWQLISHLSTYQHQIQKEAYPIVKR